MAVHKANHNPPRPHPFFLVSYESNVAVSNEADWSHLVRAVGGDLRGPGQHHKAALEAACLVPLHVIGKVTNTWKLVLVLCLG